MKDTITYVVYNTRQNGGNKAVFEQVNRLWKYGYQLKVIAIFGKQPEWFPLTVAIEKLSPKLFLSFFIRPSSILIATFWPTAYINLFIKAKKKFYLILGWEEEFYKNKLLRNCAKFTLLFPFKKITISDYLKNEVKKYTKEKDICSLPGCGINTKIFKPNRHKRLTADVYILSVLSTYSWYKGPDILLNIIKKLKEEHSNYKFILISSNETKPYDPIFDFFYHNISTKNLAKLYAQADFLLSTSRKEGFFLPGIEAMACGCVVITTDSGGVREYAISQTNAIVVKNAELVWKDDIIENLLHNKNRLNTLIANGYKTATNYRWENIIGCLENILRNR